METMNAGIRGEISMEQEKFFLQTQIVTQQEISPGIYELILNAPAVAAHARPGQFVDLYLNDASRLLPRPVSLCDFSPEDGTVRLIYRVTGANSGTAVLSSYKAGDTLNVLGPLGNGFDVPREEGDWCLVGGGIGIPPMIGLGRRIAQAGGHVIYVLGYRDSSLFLAKEASAYGALIISTDDGSCGVHGTVVDAIEVYGFAPDAYFACGPKPMLRSLKELAMKQEVPAFLSLEERMACGIGACLGCVCRTAQIDGHSHVKNARVCTEGPVFAAEAVIL